MVRQTTSLTVPVAATPSFRIDVPGSKSITNRALVIAALAEGRSRLTGALVAQDSEVMKDALTDLGFAVTSPDGTGTDLIVDGGAGRVPAESADLDLRLSGTSIRFLTALVALGHGRYRLDGNERMRERPIGDLASALQALGARIRFERDNDCPPLRVEARGLDGGTVRVAGDRSSQFLSGLLMAAPYAAGETVLEVSGELQSKPFIDMTLSVMSAFGVEVGREGYNRFSVPRGRYLGRDYAIEGDAMAAGYFWAAAAVTGGSVTVSNVSSAGLQGDARLAEVLEQMGCRLEQGEGWTRVGGTDRLRGGSFDLNDMPDQAQTLAVVALFCDSPVEILNVPNLRIKETDRLSAMAAELRKFGAIVDERPDGLLIEPPREARPATVETYGDHRMAMAFAVAGLRLAGTEILDPGCVEKTYPGFFGDLERLAASGRGL